MAGAKQAWEGDEVRKTLWDFIGYDKDTYTTHTHTHAHTQASVSTKISELFPS